MIYEALIVPHESPPTLRQIKRALLTYDKVILIDPADRELFPRNAFFMAIMGSPIIGIDTGPVRPMGKTIGYDERFEETLDFCRSAVVQQVLTVASTFNVPQRAGVTLGGVPLGGYPLNPTLVYQLYRGLASSQELLAASLDGDVARLRQELQTTDGLAMKGAADGSLNQGPVLPIAEVVSNNECFEQLTQIARARIAALLKYCGFCEARNVVPVFGTPFYGKVLASILARARAFLAAGDRDGTHIRRSRVLDLAHEEFLVDERLDPLSVDEVLRLRSAAWGHQAKAREQLFEAIFRIAESSSNDGSFLERAAAEIREYRKASEALVRERVSLHMSIKCDLGVGALAGSTALIGLLSQLESPLQSIAITLAAGGVWGLERAKEYVPKLQEIQAQTAELKRGAGFAVHDFYSRLPGAA
jgi:hypothetical protein